MAKAKVDPDTGYTPAQQQKRWNAVFNQVQKEMDTTTKAKRKVSVRQPKSDNQLKGQAIDMVRENKLWIVFNAHDCIELYCLFYETTF